MGLDSVELVMSLEQAFGITIPDEDAARLATPRDIIEYAWLRVEHADAEARRPVPHPSGKPPEVRRRWTREEVAARVRELVIEQLDCRDAYREEARLVEDLGLQ